MTTLTFPAPRQLLAGGFVVAAVATPTLAVLAPSSADFSVAACPAGESEDIYTIACTPDLVPNSPSPYTTIAGNPDLPAIDGIPCAGHNSGQCIGLAEEQQAQGPQPVPNATVSSSP